MGNLAGGARLGPGISRSVVGARDLGAAGAKVNDGYDVPEIHRVYWRLI